MAKAFELTEDIVSKYPDVDKFLLYKWARVFSLFFDTNLSKNVDWSDFYLVSRRARDIYGADSAQMKFAKSSLQVLWEGLRKTADTNHDDIISIYEWIDLLRNTDSKHLPKWLEDYSGYMFKLFDVSADGVLDMVEYTDGMNSYGYSVQAAKEAFHHFATDAKGSEMASFSMEHWNKLFKEYFFSKDKNALGNHLFGALLDTSP